MSICPSYSQDESSEEFIGEWMEKRGIRDQMVIATKVGICVALRNFCGRIVTSV